MKHEKNLGIVELQRVVIGVFTLHIQHYYEDFLKVSENPERSIFRKIFDTACGGI